MRRSFLIGLAALLGGHLGLAGAEEPWSLAASAPAPSRPAGEARSASAGYGQTCCRVWLQAYQNGFSRLMSSKCPMWPSCSAYSVEAVQQHGALGGILLTVDRLYHEGSIQRTAPRIRVGDQLRYWDPVADNVVWRKQP